MSGIRAVTLNGWFRYAPIADGELKQLDPQSAEGADGAYMSLHVEGVDYVVPVGKKRIVLVWVIVDNQKPIPVIRLIILGVSPRALIKIWGGPQIIQLNKLILVHQLPLILVRVFQDGYRHHFGFCMVLLIAAPGRAIVTHIFMLKWKPVNILQFIIIRVMVHTCNTVLVDMVPAIEEWGPVACGFWKLMYNGPSYTR